MNDEYDDLSYLAELLCGDAALEEAAPSQRLGVDHRVVLLPELPTLDVEAELDRVMPRILADVVEGINVAVDEALPAAKARFVVCAASVPLRFSARAG